MKDIWVPLSGAIAQQNLVDTIANNIANANTPGFKKDDVVFKEYLTEHNQIPDNIDLPNKEWSPEDFYRSNGAERGFVNTDGTYTNFAQGNITPTGNDLDMAIFGKGFLEVDTPNGIRFTRKGSLSLSNDGFLVTDQGFKLLSAKNNQADSPQNNLESRYINVGNGKVTINTLGEIFINNVPLNKLSLVEFRDMHELKKEGNSLYVSNNENNIIRDNVKSAIHQGFIEESNVNPINEMSSLIKAHRNFDSIQKAIKTYDDISGRISNDIAKF